MARETRDWHNFKWIRVEGVKIIQNSRDSATQKVEIRSSRRNSRLGLMKHLQGI